MDNDKRGTLFWGVVFVIIVILSINVFFDKDVKSTIIPINLKINLLDEPYGVDKEKLAFSWALDGCSSQELQSAYRIVICLREKDVKKGDYVYDSEWIESSSSASVELPEISEVLQDNQLYWWQIQVKDDSGKVSAFSEPQSFSTAVEDDWISTRGIWGKLDEQYVFLRSEFLLSDNIEKVIVNVTAASPQKSKQYVYNMYINGELIGLGPNVMNGELLYYNTYDITDCVRTGENVITSINYTEEIGAFLCQMTVFYEDGSKEIIINSGDNNKQWKYYNGDNVYGIDKAIMNTSYYTVHHECIDGTVYPHGWNDIDFDDSSWKNAIKTIDFTSLGVLTPTQTNNITRYEDEVSRIEKTDNNTYIIDLGKEIIGGISLSLDVPYNTTLTIRYGEELNYDGTVKYNMITGNVYEEQWIFSTGYNILEGIGMKTFRYVSISGSSVPITGSNIKVISIRKDFTESESYFNSSNALLNKIYDFTKYTIKATNQNLYVDCQNRERNVYEGDSYINMLSSFAFEDDYSLAGISLEYCIDNPTWPAEYQLYTIMMAWEYYLYTGDIGYLEENYNTLQGMLYNSCYDSKVGLMKKPQKELLIDWPASERDGYDEAGSYYNTVFNAICVGAYERMADISYELGESEDELFYRQRAESIRINMIRKLYDYKNFRYSDGMSQDRVVSSHQTQHATAYALAYGVYNSQNMADNMAMSIESDGRIKMSVYGAFTLLNGLYHSNNGTIARKLLTKSDYLNDDHTWAYMMYGQKATITSEAWSSQIKPNMSMAHPWGSSPASIITREMFGIKPLKAGFSEFQVKLQPGGVKEADVLIPTLKGNIKVGYEMTKSGALSMTVTVPGNTIAKVYVPTENKYRDTLRINGKLIKAIRDGEYLILELKPGTYDIYSYSCMYEDNLKLGTSIN